MASITRTKMMRSAHFSPGGEFFCVGGWDKKIAIYNTEKWELLHEVESSDVIRTIQFSSDGTLLAAGGNNSKVRFYDTTNWELQKELGRNKAIWNIAFSPDCSVVVIVGWDKKIAFYSTSSWSLLHEIERSGELTSVAYCPSDRSMSCGGYDCVSIVYNIRNWNISQFIKRAGSVLSISYCNTKSIIAVGGAEGTIGIYLDRSWSEMLPNERFELLSNGSIHVDKWKLIHSIDMPSKCNSVCFSHNGKLLAAASGDEENPDVFIFDTEGWACKKKFKLKSLIWNLTFSPAMQNGTFHLAVVGHDKACHVYASDSWQLIKTLDQKSNCMAVAYSADGSYLATGGYNKKAIIYDTHTWKVVHQVERNEPVWSISFSDDDSKIAISGWDKLVEVYQVHSWEKLVTLEGKNAICSVKFSPDSSSIAYGGEDMELSLYKFSVNGLTQITECNGVVRSITFLPDGQAFLVGSNDGSLYICEGDPPIQNIDPDLDAAFVEKPTLICRPDDNLGTTLLHRYCRDGCSANQLNKILQRVKNLDLKPHPDKNGETPLDIAYQMNHHGKCHLLASMYNTEGEQSDNAAKWLGKLAGVYDDVILLYLKRAFVELKPTDAISIANSSKFGIKKHVVKASQFPYPRNCFKVEELSQPGYPSVECITVAVGPPNFIKHAYEKIVKYSSSATFDCDSMVHTTRYLWQQVKWYYYREVVAYWVLLCMFSLGHIYTGSRYVCFGVNALLAVFFIIQEVKQCILAGKEYFSSAWNMLAWLNYVLQFASIVCTIQEGVPYTNILNFSAMILAWVCCFEHLRGFDEVGYIIATIVQMMKDIRAFFAVVVMVVCGSALSFRLLLPGKPDFVLFNGLQAVYLMLMGSNDVETMNADGFLPADQVALTTSIGTVFSNLVEMILCIVLMNALIAIMGDSYAVITEDRKNRGLQSKAQVVVEMMQLYVDKSNEICYPRWLHVLVPKHNVSLKTRAITVNERIKGLEDSFNKKHDVFLAELKMLRESIESRVATEQISQQ